MLLLTEKAHSDEEGVKWTINERDPFMSLFAPPKGILELVQIDTDYTAGCKMENLTVDDWPFYATGPRGAISMRKFLFMHARLESLLVKNTVISTKAAKILAEFLMTSHELFCLKLDTNTISANDTVTIFNALALNTSVRTFYAYLTGIVPMSPESFKIYNITKVRCASMECLNVSIDSMDSEKCVNMKRACDNDANSAMTVDAIARPCFGSVYWLHSVLFSLNNAKTMSFHSYSCSPRIVVYSDDGKYDNGLHVLLREHKAKKYRESAVTRVVFRDSKCIRDIIKTCMRFKNLKALNVF